MFNREGLVKAQVLFDEDIQAPAFVEQVRQVAFPGNLPLTAAADLAQVKVTAGGQHGHQVVPMVIVEDHRFGHPFGRNTGDPRRFEAAGRMGVADDVIFALSLFQASLHGSCHTHDAPRCPRTVCDGRWVNTLLCTESLGLPTHSGGKSAHWNIVDN
ncbi:hypothetical protein D9M73_213230 [compost metagenome]